MSHGNVFTAIFFGRFRPAKKYPINLACGHNPDPIAMHAWMERYFTFAIQVSYKARLFDFVKLVVVLTVFTKPSCLFN